MKLLAKTKPYKLVLDDKDLLLEESQTLPEPQLITKVPNKEVSNGRPLTCILILLMLLSALSWSLTLWLGQTQFGSKNDWFQMLEGTSDTKPQCDAVSVDYR
jgi:hypothetical protein